jgi:hypothetical protein
MPSLILRSRPMGAGKESLAIFMRLNGSTASKIQSLSRCRHFSSGGTTFDVQTLEAGLTIAQPDRDIPHLELSKLVGRPTWPMIGTTCHQTSHHLLVESFISRRIILSPSLVKSLNPSSHLPHTNTTTNSSQSSRLTRTSTP